MRIEIGYSISWEKSTVSLKNFLNRYYTEKLHSVHQILHQIPLTNYSRYDIIGVVRGVSVVALAEVMS